MQRQDELTACPRCGSEAKLVYMLDKYSLSIWHQKPIWLLIPGAVCPRHGRRPIITVADERRVLRRILSSGPPPESGCILSEVLPKAGDANG